MEQGTVSGWLLRLVVYGGGVGLLVLYLMPRCEFGEERSKFARVRSDHRSLATALESYYVDNGTYPAMTMRGDQIIDASFYVTAWGNRVVPQETVGRTLRARNNTQLSTLTTPIAYVTSVFGDPFADTRGIGFRYYTDQRGWILGSWGPDKDEKIGGQLLWNVGDVDIPTTFTNTLTGFDPGVERAYDTSVPQPSPLLLTGADRNGAYTYDPTNGTESPGDVWRVKQ